MKASTPAGRFTCLVPFVLGVVLMSGTRASRADEAGGDSLVAHENTSGEAVESSSDVRPGILGRRLVLAVRPLALIEAVYGGDVSLKVFRWLALTGRYARVKSGTVNRTVGAWEWGAGASYYFGESLETGYFVNFSVNHQVLKVDRAIGADQADDRYETYILTPTINRGWTWESGFRIVGGVGISDDLRDGKPWRLEPVLNFQLGWVL